MTLQGGLSPIRVLWIGVSPESAEQAARNTPILPNRPPVATSGPATRRGKRTASREDPSRVALAAVASACSWVLIGTLLLWRATLPTLVTVADEPEPLPVTPRRASRVGTFNRALRPHLRVSPPLEQADLSRVGEVLFEPASRGKYASVIQSRRSAPAVKGQASAPLRPRPEQVYPVFRPWGGSSGTAASATECWEPSKEQRSPKGATRRTSVE